MVWLGRTSSSCPREKRLVTSGMATARCVVELVVEQHVRRAVAEPPVLLAPLGVGGGAVLLREPQLHPLVEVGGGDDGGLDRLLTRVAVDGGDLLHVAHDEQPHMAAVLREA